MTNRNLSVEIRGRTSTGKTTTAVVLQDVLQKLGATVLLEDDDATPRVVADRLAHLAQGDKILNGVQVTIKVTQEPR